MTALAIHRILLILLAAGGTHAARWCHTSARQLIRAPSSQAYRAYRDLARMPDWSPVSRVDVEPQTGDSVWTLGYRGIEVSWKARVTVDECPALMQWESISGPPNRGKVTFTPVHGDGMCTMELTMSYQIPGSITKIVESSIVQTFIAKRCLEPTLREFALAMEKEEERMRYSDASPAALGRL
mmetsp:Transcript_25845/g.75760  ORF Transcript_25845/g.75760 Transcript_25845/m.75760 type:complete len:183 (-) Transcript_25845:255-803(-)